MPRHPSCGMDQQKQHKDVSNHSSRVDFPCARAGIIQQHMHAKMAGVNVNSREQILGGQVHNVSYAIFEQRGPLSKRGDTNRGRKIMQIRVLLGSRGGRDHIGAQ
jgi:hypothetical protein